MAEALVSTLLVTLKTITVDGVVAEARLLKGVKGEVRKLKTNLEAIHALLEDAEEKQIRDKAIKLWLDRLREAALDMEDALDEWRTRVHQTSFLRRKVPKFLQRFFSIDHGIVRQHRIAGNIKECNDKLNEIVKERDRYELTAASSHQNQTKKQSRRRESTSLVDESRVVGRDGVKKEIISHLLYNCCESSKEEDVEIISILGMGGSGKTTLAQVVYNDPDVKQHFPHRIWACVSEVFDETQLAKTIIAGLEGSGEENFFLLQSVSLDALLQRICESIRGKKFLLVLDDVWTEKGRDFVELKIAFKYGAPESKILVTTRNENVARVMESQHIIRLELLSHGLCWSILKKKALDDGKTTTCIDLEEVGKGIAAKCNGLPLVAQTLGGLLQFKTSKREWELILNSEMWRLDIVERDVFIPLLLSYYDLPPPIRQCFTFCAIFPKDTKIYTSRLIAFWMAQGYLGSEDDSSQWEIKGQEYFKILLARSFFQDFNFSSNGFPYAKMHDLVHDFALFICKDEFMMEGIYKGADKDVKIREPEKTRHLTFMVEDDGAYFPPSVSSAGKLRSIEIYGSGYVVFTSQALRNLFKQTKRLRLLFLHFPLLKDSTTLPKQVSKLLHLRCLDVSFCLQLKELPREICKLHNLQTLNLFYTGIERLPEEIGDLTNLRMLSTSQCYNLARYPKTVSRLTQLTQLNGVIVRTDYDYPQEFSLGDFANLKQLMVLVMKLVGESISAEEVKKMNLPNLEELQIHVDREFMAEDDSIFELLNMSRVTKRAFTDFDKYPGGTYERGLCSFD